MGFSWNYSWKLYNYGERDEPETWVHCLLKLIFFSCSRAIRQDGLNLNPDCATCVASWPWGSRCMRCHSLLQWPQCFCPPYNCLYWHLTPRVMMALEGGALGTWLAQISHRIELVLREFVNLFPILGSNLKGTSMNQQRVLIRHSSSNAMILGFQLPGLWQEDFSCLCIRQAVLWKFVIAIWMYSDN